MKSVVASFISLLVASGAALGQSQPWKFTTDTHNGTAVWSRDAAVSIEFRCAQKGAPAHDPDSVQWWLRAPDLLEILGVADGEVAQVALVFDGADRGSGPFVRQGEFVATRIERGSAMLDWLGSAGEIGLGLVSGSEKVTFPLAGAGPVLDKLLAFCATPAPQPAAKPSEPDLVDCAAPANPSARAICGTPELKALETRLATVAAERRSRLEGPPLHAFAADQAVWNDLRRACGADVACLRNSVTGRIAFLKVGAPGGSPRPVGTAVARDTAPPPLPIAAVQPLPLSQLGAVLYDERQIAQRVIIELVRQNPRFLDREQVLRAWYEITLGAGKAPQGAAQIAQARDHLSRSVSAQPAGPFLIAGKSANPFARGTYAQGVLKVGANMSPGSAASDTIGRFQVPINRVGSLDVRARSQFDISRVQVGAAQARMMQESGLQLLVVAEITRLHVVGTPDTAFSMLADGQVRYAALKRPDVRSHGGRARPLARIDPALLAVSFSPTPPTPPAGGLVATADRLRLPMHGNAVLEGVGGDMHMLIRLAGLRAHPPGKIGPNLRAYTFNTLAGGAERDHVIPPVYVEIDRHGRNLTFSRLVDEFDRAELEDRIDQLLWPRVQARLPQAPFEGIALHRTSLGEYDRARGGFPIRANVQSMGLAAQGSYPALKSLPDLLPLPVEKARELVNYLDARFGPGNRAVALVLRYRVDEVGPVDWDGNAVPQVAISPLSLSLHAMQDYEPGTDPFAFKIADFDLTAHRGSPPPVASAERVAFWTEIRKIPRSTADHVALAALGASDGGAYLEQLIEESQRVRGANEFDKPAARGAMRDLLAGAQTPEGLVLDGHVTLRDYSLEDERYRSVDYNFLYQPGELGLPRPQIRFADAAALAQVDMPPDTARLFAGDSHRAESNARFTAWVEPDLLTMEGRRPVLYVRAKRIVLSPDSEDVTGYPPAHVEVAIPEPGAGAANPASMARLVVDPPAVLPIDSDYVDLLMVRARAGSLDETAYLRMMEDRRLREATAAAEGYALPWGNFFDDPGAELNPLQRRDLLPAFTDWTRARAERLPDMAYVQSQARGALPSALRCWTLPPAPRDNFAQVLPAGLVRAMQAMEYRKRAILMDGFDRTVSRDTHRRPESVHAIYGRASLVGVPGLRIDGATRACAGRSYRAGGDALAADAHWDALISVVGAYRTPQPRQGTAVLRDVGTVEVAEIGPGTVRLTLDVTRTELVELSGGAGGVQIGRTQVLDAGSLPEPPAALDVLGIAPGDDWPAARSKATERLPQAQVAQADGPPPNFRRVTQNTILGPMPEFQALRNGHMFLDTGKGEALALIREAERDPDRVLAVGSYRQFDAAKVSQQQLVGALLQKYGAAPQTESDPSRHGPRPGQTLAWGARAGCLPPMRDELRPDFSGLENGPDLQGARTLARSFRAASLTYNGAHSIIYETCAPVVWASVGEDGEGRLHLVVWSLDMALLDEVARRPDPNAQADGDRGSQALIENAADIDL